MKHSKRNIIVHKAKRPMWKVVLAPLLFIAIPMCIFYGYWAVVLVLLVNALKFSLVNNVYFEVEKMRYKNEYAIGFIRFGKWRDLPNIEYVCVFRQAWVQDSDGDGQTDGAGYKYDVNVWHDTSKHFTIYTNPEKESAYEMAMDLAMRLGVDFLDATDPHDKKWVDLEELAPVSVN
jgi:hypothetical protein